MNDENNSTLNIQQSIDQLKNQIDELKKENDNLIEKYKRLEIDKNKFEEIAKNAQSQYVSMKFDLETLIEKTKREADQTKINITIDILKKLVGIYSKLEITYENIPDLLKEDQWIKGFIINFNEIKKIFENLGVEQIDISNGEINYEFHEPVSTKEVEQDKKGKIVDVLEKGFILNFKSNKYVIKTSKVVVGS